MATKLIISDLPIAASELQIRTLFEKFGSVSNINYQPKIAPDTAQVEMPDADAALKAITQLNLKAFLDKRVRVSQALLIR